MTFDTAVLWLSLLSLGITVCAMCRTGWQAWRMVRKLRSDRRPHA